ncbi:hypothetical protein HYR99_02195 [Candidatus Poribacteria bacterium]|nr:hypothetical protein [Candidatus Poribacteria bacterium]
MKRQCVCYLILMLFAIGLIACGDSGDDDKEQPTKPATQPQTQVPADDGDVKQEIVDFAAEEAAVRQLFTSHAVAVTERKVDVIMDHWFKLEKPEVFMAWNFWNAFTRIETWTGVKQSFAGTFEKFKNPMTVTITEVGIDSRGKNATLRANYNWLQGGKLVSAFRKDNEGKWKILAIDFSDKNLIKEIKTPVQ